MLTFMKKGCRTYAAVIVAHTAAVNIANAAFQISTPIGSKECVSSTITWSQGVPPYTLNVECELQGELNVGQTFLISEGTSAEWVPYGGLSGCDTVLLSLADSSDSGVDPQIATSKPFLLLMGAQGVATDCKGTLTEISGSAPLPQPSPSSSTASPHISSTPSSGVTLPPSPPQSTFVPPAVIISDSTNSPSTASTNSSPPPNPTESQSASASSLSASSSSPSETSGSLTAPFTPSHNLPSSDSASQGTPPTSKNIISSGPSSTQTSQGGGPSLIASTGSPLKRKTGGVIAGSVIAACAAIIGLVLALFCCIKRRRARAGMTMFNNEGAEGHPGIDPFTLPERPDAGGQEEDSVFDGGNEMLARAISGQSMKTQLATMAETEPEEVSEEKPSLSPAQSTSVPAVPPLPAPESLGPNRQERDGGVRLAGGPLISDPEEVQSTSDIHSTLPPPYANY